MKLNVRTVFMVPPKYHCVHPWGAKLTKSSVNWLIRIVHLLSFVEVPTNTEKSMQSVSKSTYTVIHIDYILVFDIINTYIT